ncbi:MAG: hypothetical protein LBH15_05530 [Treponema sp.]|jgi:hypothetical protein|nr:hypothetical protein [Treponema sp.]
MGDMSVQIQNPSGGINAEDIWVMLRETDRLIKETAQQMKETDRKMQETAQQMKETDRKMQETDRQMKETDRQMKETDRKMKETDRKIGELGGRLGEVVEHIMSPKLRKKFIGRGYYFDRMSRNHDIEDRDGRRLAEIDVLLENGECALAVEVKTRLTIRDVKDHVKRMDILRKVADDHGDKRKYLGAVAGAVIYKGVSEYALKSGFFVISPSGETVDVDAPEHFRPRIWGAENAG